MKKNFFLSCLIGTFLGGAFTYAFEDGQNFTDENKGIKQSLPSLETLSEQFTFDDYAKSAAELMTKGDYQNIFDVVMYHESLRPLAREIFPYLEAWVGENHRQRDLLIFQTSALWTAYVLSQDSSSVYADFFNWEEIKPEEKTIVENLWKTFVQHSETLEIGFLQTTLPWNLRLIKQLTNFLEGIKVLPKDFKWPLALIEEIESVRFYSLLFNFMFEDKPSSPKTPGEAKIWMDGVSRVSTAFFDNSLKNLDYLLQQKQSLDDAKCKLEQQETQVANSTEVESKARQSLIDCAENCQPNEKEEILKLIKLYDELEKIPFADWEKRGEVRQGIFQLESSRFSKECSWVETEKNLAQQVKQQNQILKSWTEALRKMSDLKRTLKIMEENLSIYEGVDERYEAISQYDNYRSALLSNFVFDLRSAEEDKSADIIDHQDVFLMIGKNVWSLFLNQGPDDVKIPETMQPIYSKALQDMQTKFPEITEEIWEMIGQPFGIPGQVAKQRVEAIEFLAKSV